MDTGAILMDTFNIIYNTFWNNWKRIIFETVSGQVRNELSSLRSNRSREIVGAIDYIMFENKKILNEKKPG